MLGTFQKVVFICFSPHKLRIVFKQSIELLLKVVVKWFLYQFIHCSSRSPTYFDQIKLCSRQAFKKNEETYLLCR